MSDSSARRGAHTDTPGAPSRIRLGKQQWQDIRRACRLGDESGLHSVELHGVRVTFRFQKTCQGPAQDKAVPRPAQAGRTTGGSSANAQRSPTPPARPQDNQRPRRKASRQRSMRASKEQTTAGESTGEASQTAGETAGAGLTVAQSPSVCSPRRPNSRQRRSANRLVEFIRAKGMQAAAGAQPPQTATPQRASPKRTHEDSVLESGDVREGAAANRRRVVDIDFEARQEAAAALYTAWRQHTLATTTNSSPKRALEHGAQEGSTKRGSGPQRRLINLMPTSR